MRCLLNQLRPSGAPSVQNNKIYQLSLKEHEGTYTSIEERSIIQLNLILQRQRYHVCSVHLNPVDFLQEE